MAQLRAVRRSRISPEAVALFLKLEGMSERSEEFDQGSRQLANMLGLTSEWWTGNHVNDRSKGPCYSPEYAAHRDWHTCREVREALLVAAQDHQPQR